MGPPELARAAIDTAITGPAEHHRQPLNIIDNLDL